MKKLVVTGVVGLAAISAFFIYQSSQGPSEVMTVDVPTISKTDIRAKVIETLPVRAIENSEAETALAQLGLWEPSDTVNWDRRDGENGNYTFTNLNLADGDEKLSAANFEVLGVRLLEGEQVFFDGLRADNVSTTSGGGDMLTIGSIGMKMPKAETVIPGVVIPDAENPASLLDYLADVTEPGTLAEFPEIYVENAKMTASTEIYDWTITAYKESDPLATPADINTKAVDEVTSIDFAALTKVVGGTGYSLQATNLVQNGFNYVGTPKTTEIQSFNLSGFDVDVIERLEGSFDPMSMVGDGGNMYKPLFLSMDIQGMKIDNPKDSVRVDQATIRHSDTRANQFTRRIDVPQIYLATKNQPQNNENNKIGHSSVESMLTDLGYEDMSLSLTSQMTFDKINKSISEDNGRLSAPGAFDFGVSYKVLDIERFGGMFGGRSGNSAAKIEFGQLEFSDRGLMDKVFDRMVEDQGLTLEEVKNSAKGTFLMTKSMAETDYQKEVIQSALDAYSAWIDNGGKFQINLRPQRPIGFGEYSSLMGFGSAQRLPSTSETGEVFATDEVANSIRLDAIDDLLRETNVSFDHYIAD